MLKLNITIYESVALFLSIVSLVFSVYVYIKNRLYSKISVEFELSNSIRKALSDLQDARYNFIGFSKMDDEPEMLEEANAAYKKSIENLYSAYNEACYHLFKGSIDNEYFEENYSSEIINLSTNEDYADIIKLEKYPSLQKFITKKIQ